MNVLNVHIQIVMNIYVYYKLTSIGVGGLDAWVPINIEISHSRWSLWMLLCPAAAAMTVASLNGLGVSYILRCCLDRHTMQNTDICIYKHRMYTRNALLFVLIAPPRFCYTLHRSIDPKPFLNSHFSPTLSCSTAVPKLCAYRYHSHS